MKIIYMGTPEFAVPPLKALIESNHEIPLVVTQPDRIKGRGKKVLPPPVKEEALAHGIKVLQPERIKGNEEFINEIKEITPDVIVVAAYGRILPGKLLEIPKYVCINIHASLLPRWRGAAPMQYAILSGDEKTGITIMQMAEGLDTGDMLSKVELPLYDEYGLMYYPTLSDKLSKLGGPLLLDTLKKIDEGKVNPEKQDDNFATYAGMIKKEDGKIDFANMTPWEIKRMICAYEPWPGAYCLLNGETLKFKGGVPLNIEEFLALDSSNEGTQNSIHNSDSRGHSNGLSESELNDLMPGTIIRSDNSGIYIKAKEGIFNLTELQIPGKNWMDSGSFLRGHKLEAYTVLE